MPTLADETTLRDWDATETAAAIRRKDVSASEVLEAAIARAERAALLGAIVTPTFDRARSAPVANDAALGGVPTFIKDLAQVKGVATTWGSAAAGHYISRKTERFAARFEQTGVAILGKSATPELGLTATTEPMGRPPCRNPWDPTRSSGGSSGGAAALVASGVVPIAHASDGGGSIRIPAACCGLVGLKPSRFRIDMEGSHLLPVNIAVDGIVSRTVRDTVAFYRALESANPPKKLRTIAADLGKSEKPLRIGLFDDSPAGTPVHSDVREAVQAAGRLAESLGHRVEAIACPFDESFVEDFLAYWGFVAWIQTRSAKLMIHRGFDTSGFEPWTNGLAETCAKHPRATLGAVRRLRAFAATYLGVMSSYDVLLSPVCAEPAVSLGCLAPDQPFDVVRERLRAYCPFAPIQNAAGAPAISLPLGRSAEGLPTGVQFAAAPGNDSMLLDLALEIELASPWPRLAPSLASP